jgi:hypothetical protein
VGGINAKLDFYLASPRTEANFLDPQFGATVTGRELLGLTTFGYSLHPNTGLGEVYVCTDQGRALTATFVAYENAFSEAKTRGGFKSLVNAGTRTSVLRHPKGGGVSDEFATVLTICG